MMSNSFSLFSLLTNFQLPANLAIILQEQIPVYLNLTLGLDKLMNWMRQWSNCTHMLYHDTGKTTVTLIVVLAIKLFMKHYYIVIVLE